MIIYALFLLFVTYAATEDVKNEAEPKIDTFAGSTDKTVLQQTQPYPQTPEQSSFMSRIASWIYPFGGSDSVASETQGGGAPYLPPVSQEQKNCNPCNREPWIPVATNYGKNTLIGFVQPAEFNKQVYLGNGGSQLQQLNPPPSSQYGPPVPNSPPLQYGAPSNVYAVPVSNTYGPPKTTYGPPNNRQPKLPPVKFIPKQISPPNSNYGPPPNNYGVPNQPRSPPSHFLTNFRPPPLKLLPVRNHLTPPRPNSKYGPPNHSKPNKSAPRYPQNSAPPSYYGLRQRIPPSNNHPPNIRSPNFNLNHNVAPPPLQSQLPINYRPNANGFGPATEPSKQYLPAPVPSDSYGKPILGPDANLGNLNNKQNNGYLPPIEQLPQSSSIEDVSELHGNGVYFHKPIAFPNLSRWPVLPIHSAQPFQNIIEPQHLATLPYNSGSLVFQAPQQNYLPVDNANLYQNTGNYQAYNNPTNAIQNSHNVQASGVGIYSDQNNYQQPPNQQTSVEIIKSVQVAGFLASVEHPINIIQSPLVDLSTSEFNENAFLEGHLKDEVKLSQNPIVVDDTHVAASSENASIVIGNNQKRNNEKDLGAYSFESQTRANTQSPNIQETSLFNPKIVNEILHRENSDFALTEQEKANNTFTVPPVDYSSWQPSPSDRLTSMTPPPKGESPWLAAINGVGRQIVTTAKTPKQIQIIIPYISNHKPTPFQSGATTKIPAFSSGLNQFQGSRENSFSSTTNAYTPRHTNPYSASSAFRIGNNQKELPVFTQPPTSESVWMQHGDYDQAGSQVVTATAYTQKPTTIVTNIRDLLQGEADKKYPQPKNLPFDIINLQKNIDDWTAQEYSNKLSQLDYNKVSTVAKLVPSKKIPDEYLTTQPYSEATTFRNFIDDFYDHLPAGSNTKESKAAFDDVDTNLIITETTTSGTTITEDISTTSYPATKASLGSVLSVNDTKPSWELADVKLSTSAKEKIYVVTPQPARYGFSKQSNLDVPIKKEPKKNVSFSGDRFSVSVDKVEVAGHSNADNLKIVLSEWPHLINDLETTTSTSRPKLVSHPLFGLMDLSSYTPPPNATVETYAGHSKVITIVTPGSTTKKKTLGQEEKKTTPKTGNKGNF